MTPLDPDIAEIKRLSELQPSNVVTGSTANPSDPNIKEIFLDSIRINENSSVGIGSLSSKQKEENEQN